MYKRPVQKDPMDFIFDMFPYIFGAIMVLLILGAIVQFAVIGFVGYQVVTDPEGSASFVGNVAAKAIHPVIEQFDR